MKIIAIPDDIAKLRRHCPDVRLQRDLSDPNIYLVRGVSAEKMRTLCIEIQGETNMPSPDKKAPAEKAVSTQPAMPPVKAPSKGIGFADKMFAAIQEFEDDLQGKVDAAEEKLSQVTDKFEQEAIDKLAGLEEKVLERQNAQDQRIGNLEQDILSLRNAIKQAGKNLIDKIEEIKKTK